MKNILIVEDDKLIAALERDYLMASEFDVEIAEDGKECLRKFISADPGDYDLIILDVMLPEIDGFELCRMIRSKSDVPIMMVTARKEDVDKIRGLGADDYMVKPFSPAEMVARVKAHIKMHERLKACSWTAEAAESDIFIRDLKISRATRRVFMGDTEIKLVNTEYELLLFLAENPDVVFFEGRTF